MSLERRQLLAALLGLGVAGLAPAVGRTEQPSLTPPGADVAALERIGKAWLAAHPGESRQTLAARLPAGGWNATTARTLREQVASDFRAGRVFIHRGWRLADTEAAVCALLALTAG